MITFWICHLYQFDTRQVVHHMFKLNNYRSLSDLTRILLNPKHLMNAVRNDLAQSDAPFLSTTGAPKHPVELCRHLTHKIGNTSSHYQRSHHPCQFQTNLLLLEKSVRALNPSQWRHQLLCTACPVNTCSAICLALGCRGRLGTLGTMCSSPSTASTRIGSCAPPAFLGFGFSSLTGWDPARNSTILNLREVASHQYRFFSASC